MGGKGSGCGPGRGPKVKQNKGGRPTALKNLELISEEFWEAVKLLVPLNDLADLIGVSRNTIHNWMKWGEKGREPYKSVFYDVYRRTQAQGKLEMLKEIKRGMPSTLLDLLGRRDPENYAAKQTTDVNIKTRIEYLPPPAKRIESEESKTLPSPDEEVIEIEANDIKELEGQGPI